MQYIYIYIINPKIYSIKIIKQINREGSGLSDQFDINFKIKF